MLTERRISRRQRGLSLVELMVGITVGMIVTAGASMLAVNQINEHRRLMQETQIQQDLRAAADLLQQDIRRAGFRGDAKLGVWAPPSGDVTASAQAAKIATDNIYSKVIRTDDSQYRSLEYNYARPDVDGLFNANGTLATNEYFGIKWSKITKTLYLKLGKKDGGDNWQPITDPDSVEIVDFDINVAEQDIKLEGFCDNGCGATCPLQKVRRVDFRIQAKAKGDSNVVRTLSGSERIRADSITGSCAS